MGRRLFSRDRNGRISIIRRASSSCRGSIGQERTGVKKENGNRDIMKTRTDFFTAGNAKGGSMNRIERKETACDAAKLFQEEVRELMPDVPREELCGMVDDFIYYQTDDMSREEADAVTEATCMLK
jgi:hypothetical protein